MCKQLHACLYKNLELAMVQVNYSLMFFISSLHNVYSTLTTAVIYDLNCVGV